MQQHIKGVGPLQAAAIAFFLRQLFGQHIQQHAVVLQLVDQGLFAVGAAPGLQEGIERFVLLGQVDAGEVAQAFCDQLAVGIQVLNALTGNGHGDAAADLVFAGLVGAARCVTARASAINTCWVFGSAAEDGGILAAGALR